MSYLRKFEFNVTPETSYPVIRNCSVCGGKSVFINSNNFRVNANGHRVDVWLIYQCNKCNHTYNLTIYERLSSNNLSSDQISSFMENDKELAMKYGTDKSFFVRNRAEIDWKNINYLIINTETQKLATDEYTVFKSGDLIQISNPCWLKIRIDKIISDTLHITRNKIKQLQETGTIEVIRNHSDSNIDIAILGDIYADSII